MKVTATLSVEKMKQNESPIMVQIDFSFEVTNLNLSKVNVVGADLYKDPSKCSENYVSGTGAGPYTIGLVPLKSSSDITVSLAEGAGYSTSQNKISEASNEINVLYDNNRPTLTLEVQTSHIPYNLTLVGHFSKSVSNFTAEDFTTRGCKVESLTLSNSTAEASSFEAYLTTLPSRDDISIQVLANQTVDEFGNGNQASNEIYYSLPGYHSPGLVFKDSASGEVFVPWGGTFCLTPLDETIKTTETDSGAVQQRFVRVSVRVSLSK